MIQLYECPNCGGDTSALAKVGRKTYCPACAPMPGKKPHDYQPIMLGGIPVKECCGTVNEDGRRQYRTAYIEIPRKNGKSAIADAADCASAPCGVA